jgi:hypothetical protein
MFIETKQIILDGATVRTIDMDGEEVESESAASEEDAHELWATKFAEVNNDPKRRIELHRPNELTVYERH